MGPTIFRTVRMLSDEMRVQLGFYLGHTAGHKVLQRYVDTGNGVGVDGVSTNGISSLIYTERLNCGIL